MKLIRNRLLARVCDGFSYCLRFSAEQLPESNGKALVERIQVHREAERGLVRPPTHAKRLCSVNITTVSHSEGQAAPSVEATARFSLSCFLARSVVQTEGGDVVTISNRVSSFSMSFLKF